MGQGQGHSIAQRRRGVKGPSPAELDELRALWGTMPVTEIARQLGISRRTAYRWYCKAHSVSHLRTLCHISGHTVASLASALRCGPERIEGWIKRGWLKRKRSETEDGEPVDFSDTGVLRLWVEHPRAMFPGGMTEEQSAWLAGMQRTAHQGKAKAS